MLRVLVFLLRSVLLSYTLWPHYGPERREQVKQRWALQLLNILGLRVHVHGQARPGAKLVVSNHVSWLDILAIDASLPSRFVSKAEIARWPLIGRLATYAGTLYLVREKRRDAMRVLGIMAQAMKDGDTVAVFPEGTTGAGPTPMHFHGNLVQAAIDAQVPVQPIVLRYSEADHAFSPRAMWVGDTTLVQSLWWVATARGLAVHVTILPAQGTAHADRRALAALLQAQVADSLRDQH
ncbi:MAG: hypothetical protein RI907_2349 [Pseudomonadota bacterium]